MRRVIAESRMVRAGDLVRIHLRLPRNETWAKISVWARCGDDEFSPYVDERKAELLEDGKPLFLTPMKFNLSEKKRHLNVEFFSETAQQFRVVQEIDSHKDPKVRARIKSHGKVATSIRRYCRDLVGSIRSFAAPYFGTEH